MAEAPKIDKIEEGSGINVSAVSEVVRGVDFILDIDYLSSGAFTSQKLKRVIRRYYIYISRTCTYARRILCL